MACTRPASPGLAGFSRPPSVAVSSQYSARAAAAAARSRTAACLTFPAAALVLYLAAFGLPWRSAGAGLTARDTVEVAGRAADAASAAAAAAPAAAEKAIQLLKRPGAKALWAVAVVPDAKGKANLLRGANKALCASVAPPGGKAVAIVGNGPLADASRQEIAAADAIVRFNEMNNRLPGERLDAWFARHNYRQPAPYWGFWQLRNGSRAEPLIEQAHAVLLLGGNASSPESLLATYPTLGPKLFQADTQAYQRMYERFFSEGWRGEYPPDPSTGLLGLLQVLACVKAAGEGAPRVHVYGFNWSGKHWLTHQMGAEETIVRNLVEPFSVEFHATACGGLRACEAACDTESFQISEAGDGEECRKRAEERQAAKELEQPAAIVDEHVTDTVEEAIDMLPP